MRMSRPLSAGAAACLMFLAACESAAPRLLPTESAPVDFLAGESKVVGNYSANVGAAAPIIGEYTLTARTRTTGETEGSFVFSASTPDGTIKFIGDVTCLVVDEALKRAWIGAVITRNTSTRASHNGTNPIHQAGHQVWFRVADRSEDGMSVPDRTTFLGFEGALGINTSAQYCATRPWGNDGIAIQTGNLTVF